MHPYTHTHTHTHTYTHADSEMAGRHRARFRSIQIIRTGVVAAKDCRRPHTTQYHVSSQCDCCRLTQ